MAEDETDDEIDYDFDSDGGEFDAPLYAYRSSTGRIFLSSMRPPDDFSVVGDVEEVGDFFVLEEDRPVPTISWIADEPAMLYRLPGTSDYAIGFADGEEEPPPGYQLLGSGFAFIVDEASLRRAIDADQ